MVYFSIFSFVLPAKEKLYKPKLRANFLPFTLQFEKLITEMFESAKLWLIIAYLFSLYFWQFQKH